MGDPDYGRLQQRRSQNRACSHALISDKVFEIKKEIPVKPFAAQVAPSALSERNHHAYISSSQAVSVRPRSIADAIAGANDRSCLGAVGDAGDRWSDQPGRVRE